MPYFSPLITSLMPLLPLFQIFSPPAYLLYRFFSIFCRFFHAIALLLRDAAMPQR